ncbi:MAG: GAF domain-containing protein [Chloroflexota bacterium]
MGGQRDLERELAESRAREAALAEVLGVMRRTPGERGTILEAVLETVVVNAVRLCSADNGSIARIGSDGWRLVANVGEFGDPEGFERNWSNRPIEPNRRSLTGRVLMDRRTTTIVDVTADPEYDPGRGLLKERSLIGVPLTRGDEIVGVLLLRRAEPKAFTPEQIHLLETFADQASIAIENVRLFDETKESLEQQTAIASVLGAISRSAFDLNRVLDTIIENAVRLTDAANGTILGIEGSTGYVLVTTEPESERTNPGALEPSRRSLTGRVLLERRTVQIEDIGSDTDYDLTGYSGPACTMLGVPLHLRGELIGVLLIRRRGVRPFNADQIRIAETFADQAAIAMDNVRLFNETKEALERETATTGILRVMASSPTEVQPILDAIAENAARVCGASDAHVYRVEGEVLKQWAHFGPIPGLAPGESLPLSRGSVIGRCILDRRAIHMTDAVDLDPAEYPISVQLQQRWGHRTALSVPLIRHGVGIGGIAIRRMEVQPFTRKQIELLETFADQAAIAIANVELFQTVERQRAELSRFLSPQVAALITSEQGAKMLEGHRRQITVAFCDLRGFTAFAETAEPEEVLGVLRDYHRAMGEHIVKHQGTLEHFAGDGMMVFFNDPLPVERHELQAVRMACTMRDSFEEMARAWRKRGYELGFGVGIATGYATLGRIGFEGRYDYGAIGNVVILAQRLSAEAKAGQILLSQRVHAAVETDVETSVIGELTLKGFSRPVPAFGAENVKTPTPARP